MKKAIFSLTLIIAIIMSSVGVIPKAEAASINYDKVIEITTYANIRSSPNGTIVGQATTGTRFNAYKYSDTWYIINYNGKACYTYYTNFKVVNTSTKTTSSATVTTNTSSSSKYNLRIQITTLANIRSSPNGTIVGQAKNGTQFDAYKYSNDWYIINYNGTARYTYYTNFKIISQTSSSATTNSDTSKSTNTSTKTTTTENTSKTTTDTKTSTNTSTTSSNKYNTKIKITTYANIRRTPNGTILGTATVGTIFDAYKYSDYWYEIKYNGSTAYTYYTNVTVVSSSAQTSSKEADPSVSKTSTVSTSTKLYYFPYATTVYTTSYKASGYTIYAGSFYTGHEDSKYKDYICIDYMNSTYLVKKSSASVQSNAKVLATSSVGQMGGKLWGRAACGPTAAAILVNSEKGTNWSKDDLITYSHSHYLVDQGYTGSLLTAGSGMTAPKLVSLINGYSGGKYTARNIYNTTPNTQMLKEQIDKGKRAIVVCRYTGFSNIVSSYNGGTHFVVVCGYEYINGVLYFYYADPFYGSVGSQYSASLFRVGGNTLSNAMEYCWNKEPRCIITLD